MLNTYIYVESDGSRRLFSNLFDLGFQRRKWKPGEHKQLYYHNKLQIYLKEYENDGEVEIYIDDENCKIPITIKSSKIFERWGFSCYKLTDSVIDRLLKDVKFLLSS